MDDEFDDKGWDGDMGDGEVSMMAVLWFCIMLYFMNPYDVFFCLNL
jgi:hypothetical protein